MQMLQDAGVFFWIMIVLAAMFSLPLLMRTPTAPPSELAGRTLVAYCLAVPLAASAHLFNWATALLLSGALIVAAGHAAGEQDWLRIVTAADPRQWLRRARWSARRALLDRRIRAMAGLAVVSASVPAVQALLNTRLSSADEYALLAATYRLMSGEWVGTLLPASALAAMVSIVSSTDPLHVIRFIKPVLHLACAVSAASLVRRATWQRHLAWLSGAAAGVALLRVHSSVDLLAVTTLFGGLAMLQRARRVQVNVTGAFGVLALSMVAVPGLGIFAAAAAAVGVGAPLRFVPEGIGLVMLLAALVEPQLFDGAASLAPCLLAVGAALTCRHILRRPLRAIGRVVTVVPFARAALVAPALVLFALPQGMEAEYVEPDSAARQALALKDSGLPGRWAMVGGQELQIQMGGAVPVIDVQEFVARYATSAGTARFQFDVAVDRVFVFVEKRSTLSSRAALSRRDTALDRAVYRIPRLRSNLQRSALEICEAYRRAHAGVSVYHEDQDLRIYSVAL